MKQNLLPAAGLLMSILFGSCKREAQEKTTPEAQQKTELPEVIKISASLNGQKEIEYADKGQQHRVELQGDNITAHFIEGKRIPVQTHPSSQAALQRILQQLGSDEQGMQKGLLPPKAKGPEAGNVPIEAIDLSYNKMNAPANEKTDRERAEAERNAAKKTVSQK